MIKKSIIYSVLIIASVLSMPALSGQDKQNSPSNTPKPRAIPIATFKHKDIGNPSLKGIIKKLTNGIDITAGGADIWGTKDEFSFAYFERTGDFDIVSRIESLQAADVYTKAGLMAREDFTPSCRHIYFQVFSDNNPRNKNNGGYEFQYHQTRDSLMKAIYPKTSTGRAQFPVKYPNTWIRLQRTGNDFTGYYSTDGIAWKVYTTFKMELNSKVYLGLAVTSHNTGHAAAAKFRNISEIKH